MWQNVGRILAVTSQLSFTPPLNDHNYLVEEEAAGPTCNTNTTTYVARVLRAIFRPPIATVLGLTRKQEETTKHGVLLCRVLSYWVNLDQSTPPLLLS